MTGADSLTEIFDDTFTTLDRVVQEYRPRLTPVEVGRIVFIGQGIMHISGLPGLRAEELVRMHGNRMGWVFDLAEDETGIVLMCEEDGLAAGDEVRRTGRIMDTPVGEELIGRVVDALGRPLDGKGPIMSNQRRPVESPAPSIMDRSPVTTPLQTGIKAVDALIPIGRGQRELIVGDRQTGKTALALDAILNQKDQDVVCIYCAVGKRSSATAKALRDLSDGGAMAYSVIVATTEDDPPGLQFIAPYAATALGEFFMERGRDVLVIYDDLTRHARAYREVSLLLRRPPGREAYPGDIFYIHSRLLERSTHLSEELGGGSLTSLPIIETEAQNISAYIPTNLISITDGQIYLSPTLFHKGVLPAVDVGKSVSRVGGKTQLPAFRQVAGDLRLSYSQFEELESFARFGTRMDEETQKTIERGRRVREVLKQHQRNTMPAAEQVAVLMAVNNGLFDNLSVAKVREAEEKIRQAFRQDLKALADKIYKGEKLSEEDREWLLRTAGNSLEEFTDTPAKGRQGDGHPGES